MKRHTVKAAVRTVVLSAFMLPAAKVIGSEYGLPLPPPPAPATIEVNNEVITGPALTGPNAPAPLNMGGTLPTPAISGPPLLPPSNYAPYQSVPASVAPARVVPTPKRATYSHPQTLSGPTETFAKPAVLMQNQILQTSGPQSFESANAGAIAGPPAQQPGYVNLGAPLYPSPRPNVPIQTGSTMITNQAFAPHEFLYPHTYRAIYPPYYHRVKGGWILTPFGVRSHEHWELQGTQVQVKYRSQYPHLLKGGWHPPATSTRGGLWR